MKRLNIDSPKQMPHVMDLSIFSFTAEGNSVRNMAQNRSFSFCYY